MKKIKFWRNFLIVLVKQFIYRHKNRITRKMIHSKINHPKCKCGNKFNVSWPVIHRLINCPRCGRSYWYERDMKMNYTWEKVGRHDMRPKKFEKELEKYGRSR